MYKPLLQIILCLLSMISAFAQRNFSHMKLNPYPGIPATFHDSTQISPFQQTSTSKTKLHSTSLSNSCDTKASFTPANDTTVYTGQAISFTNTSQNADSFEWFNDINNRTTETDFTNFVPSVGVTQIMLVAHRDVCTDTAVTYIVNNGTPPADPKRMITSYGLPNLDESSVSVVQAKSDGYLLVGESTDENSIFFSYIIRVSETGCVLWSKRMPANVYAVPRSAISTYDSGFVLLESSLDSLEKNSFLCKFDDKGNIVWSRSYVGTVALSSAAEIRELSDHSLMVLSGEFGYDFFSITSMDETGIFRWQKRYLTNDAFGQNQTFFSDVVDRNGDAWLSGGYMQYNGPNEYDIFAILFKVDLATGNIMWSNAYHHPSKNYRFSGIHFYKDGLIMNGFIDSLEFPSQYETPYLETLVETDLDGNIRDSKSINFPAKLDAYAGDRLITHADNSMSLFYYGVEYRPTQEFPAEHSFLLRLDANKNIVWQNQYTGFTIGSNLNVAPAPFKGLAMLGRKLNNLSNPASGLSLNFVLVKVDSNGMGPGPHCDFYETFTKLQNLTINPTSLGPFAVSDFNLQTIEHPLTLINPNTEIRYNCPDYIPFCSFMKLSGKNSVCNLNDTVAFVAHKDPSCADPVKWTYDVSNIKTVYVDGNKALLTFAKPGVYKILAEKPFPCTAINDSMMVTVAGPIDLGAPRTKCKSDSLLITLPAGFQTYEWQPLYNIAMPFGQGQVIFFPRIDTVYHLTVTDAAGCRESADLPFHILPSADLNIGNDTAICTGGSATFSAGTGFSLLCVEQW